MSRGCTCAVQSHGGGAWACDFCDSQSYALPPAPEPLPLPEPSLRALCIECGECFHAEDGEEVCRACAARVVREGIR